jgi:hypothetical protein
VLFASCFTTLNSATINTTLNIIGNIIGNGTALTNLNYNARTNPPNLSYLPLSGGILSGGILINTADSGVILMKEAVQHLDKQALMVRIQAVRLLLIPHE